MGQCKRPPNEFELHLIQLVFAYWKEHLGTQTSKLTKERIGFCLARLLDGYSVAELKAVIDVVRQDPWWLGRNPRHKAYTDFQFIFRNDTRVDIFLNSRTDARTDTGLHASDEPTEQRELL